MKIAVQREAILKPLQAISGIVDKKQALPILANVLFTPQDHELLLTGTDMETQLIGKVRVHSMVDPTILTVSSRKLADICRALPEESVVHLTAKENQLVIQADGSRFILNTLPADEFPSLKSVDYPIRFTVKQGQLKNLLGKTYFAIGQQDVRHYLNGCLLEISGQSIRCFASDGHRFAMSLIDKEAINDIDTKVILPRKSVLELLRLLDNEVGKEILVCINSQRIEFSNTNFIFTSKILNSLYPDYNRLITPGTLTAVGDREGIRQALHRVSVLLSEKFRGVRCLFDANKLHITANNPDQEHAEETIPLDYEGPKVEIAFNAAYLLDALAAMATSEKIRWIFNADADQGVHLKPFEEEDRSLYVIMPMRL